MKKIVFILFVLCSIYAYGQDNFHKVELLTYGGLPVSDNPNTKINTLYNNSYIVGYSDNMKNPVWVAYRLGNMKKAYTEANITKWERTRGFKVDVRTDAKVKHGDYTSSGYDRGHMAPNSAMMVQYGQMAQMETYFMSNICPQTPELNRGIWQKLEAKVRTEISQDDTKNKEIHDVFVLTGPIFEDSPVAKLESGVPIPSSFYKILVYGKGYGSTLKAVAFKFPQKPTSDSFLDYVTTVDEIESLTGLNFFSNLSIRKQKNLESKKRDFKLQELK